MSGEIATLPGRSTETDMADGETLTRTPTYQSLADFLGPGRVHLEAGPAALILAEDEVEVASTLRHHRDAGFRTLVLVASAELDLPSELGPRTVRVVYDMRGEGALEEVVNGAIGVARDGIWLYYCYNAEYLFYPFSEHRSVGEMLAFHTEERREAMLTFVVDLYAGDLDAHPTAVSLEDAHLDKSGYYALARPDPDNHNHPKERQLDFFGGLRWRFEEHVPAPRRRIDRVGLFRARKELDFLPDHTFAQQELNTYSCPWHNNLTAAICSFRTAKALKRNPGSAFDIRSFRWHNSARFDWHSRQLLDLGLIEPGQWF